MASPALATSEASKLKAEPARTPALKPHPPSAAAAFPDFLSRAGNLAIPRAAIAPLRGNPAALGILGAAAAIQPKLAISQLGNVECSKKNRLGVQTKLQISETGDIYEQQADRIAGQVMAGPAHIGIRDALPRIQRSSGQSNGMDVTPPSVDHALASSGVPLNPALRQEMEQRFGYDFSTVRVHTGVAAEQSAREVNAHAYTVGHNIVFGTNRFAPETRDGRRLIAHELTHVVQQEQSGIAAIQCYSDTTILAELEQNVREEETKAQQVRIEHLSEMFNALNPVEADHLYKRLTARKKGDRKSV